MKKINILTLGIMIFLIGIISLISVDNVKGYDISTIDEIVTEFSNPDLNDIIVFDFFNNGTNFIYSEDSDEGTIYLYNTTSPYTTNDLTLYSSVEYGERLTGIVFENGTSAYVTWKSNGRFYHITMSSPYNLSTYSNDYQVDYSLPTKGVKFIGDDKIFMASGDSFHLYTTPNPYDYDNMELNSSFTYSGIGLNGATISKDGKHVYATNYNYLYEIKLTSPYDFNTASFVQKVQSPYINPGFIGNVIMNDNNPEGVLLGVNDANYPPKTEFFNFTNTYEIETPTITINTPSNFTDEENIYINGTVTGGTDISLDINNTNFVNLGNATHFSFKSNPLTPQSFDILINSSNTEGGTYEETHTININGVSPELNINNNSIFTGDVYLTGNASDTNLNSVSINSSLFDNIGTTNIFNFKNNSYFSDGTYINEITAIDTTGINTTKELSYSVYNPPIISGVSYPQIVNDTFYINGSVNDESSFSTTITGDFINTGTNADFSFRNTTSLPYGIYTFNITATDTHGASTTREIEIISQEYLNFPPTTPSLNFNNDNFRIFETVIMEGYNSTDEENDSITYMYRVTHNGDVLQEFSNDNNFLLYPSLEGKFLNFSVKATTNLSDSEIYSVTKQITTNRAYIGGNATGTIKMGECPDNEFSYKTMWMVFFFLVGIGFLGIIYKLVPLVLFSGVILLFFTLIIGSCGTFLGVINFVVGLLYIIFGLNINPLSS